ncbi:Dps family protein [Sunxiuqinia elliptica]|uniref:Starvation-inducible DNA-binding protein n=1 Tax=Sunxiuqinia elliptica TaxID=655355 RepID=A0A4V3BZ13_9BACT|nr:DNA starvation/stationary phase protection protein [Sunxiuqinia elliptica]TDO04739.1 starvation-inducible DNA-binding protein [Sunxiuqinia elliptica]TDO64287.1 starvation-inducible DNA-binding protein [Sunxiuqinia elliptica]
METKEKTFVRLGFNQKDTSELIEQINLLISSYHVHYQKLRNFHWNVTGKDFFDLHEKFEELYDFAKVNIDDLAERVRVFGATPTATLRAYLDASKIAEPEGIPSPDDMVDQVLSDFEILLSQMINVLETANDLGDVSTIDLVNSMVKQTEKYYWMFTSWLEEK